MKKTPRALAAHLGLADDATPGIKAEVAPENVVVASGKKYRLVRMIAEGGMGAVYEAHDTNCRRNVALKLLHKKASLAETDALVFVAEAQITAQLEHPGIVPVYDVGIDSKNRVYYTMKYVRGETLGDVLIALRQGRSDAVERYPLARLLNIFQKICDALAFAHDRNVIHRDVKPDNVIIGEFGEVVLSDWGLAKRLGPSPEVPPESALSRDTEAVITIRDECDESTLKAVSTSGYGSPGFMPPEQVRRKNVDTRSDIYGLGAILYAMLTLRATVAGKNIRDMVQRILSGDFPPPALFNPPAGADAREPGPAATSLPHCPGNVIPEVLSDIAMKALASDPEDRYQTIKQLQEDVEAYQSGLVWLRVIDEDFSRPDIEARWEVVGGKWDLRPGQLSIEGGEPMLVMLKAPVAGDVRIDFECRQDGGFQNDVSCFLNALPLENKKSIPFTGYEFKYGGYDNSMNLLIRNGTRLWFEQTRAPIKRGRKYSVRAERIGPVLRMIVNNRELFRVVDPEPLSGPDRAIVGLFGWRATTRYTRIRVYRLQAPWKSDFLDFADQQLQKGNFAMAESLYREAVSAREDPIRSRRAKDGMDAAKRRKTMRQSLPRIRKRIEHAWPSHGVRWSLDQDGLTVDVSFCGITDLEPLRGLPIRHLDCQGNSIRSLEPLHGSGLVTLNCSKNPLSSLDPLRGLALTNLVCEACGEIDSLEPLRGMPLSILNCGGNPIASLEPLAGISLALLVCWGHPIQSLEPLRGMPLSVLNLLACGIRDLRPLEESPLGTVNICSNSVESLEPLRELPLANLYMNHNRVSDLRPLVKMALSSLACTGNRIRDLAPLAGLPLGVLTCANNAFKTIDPLIEAPPAIFRYDSASLSAAEIRSARDIWERSGTRAGLVREADTLLAARAGSQQRLRAAATSFEGRSYLHIPRYLTWEAARVFCEQMGGHLAVIRNEKQQQFFVSTYGPVWAWMGLRVTERGPEWVTGEPATYTNFSTPLHAAIPGPKIFAVDWVSLYETDHEESFLIEWDS